MRQLLLATALALVATQAGAFSHHHGGALDSHGNIIPAKTVAAPEIDPGTGLSAVLLLCGALLVIRGRRRA